MRSLASAGYTRRSFASLSLSGTSGRDTDTSAIRTAEGRKRGRVLVRQSSLDLPIESQLERACNSTTPSPTPTRQHRRSLRGKEASVQKGTEEGLTAEPVALRLGRRVKHDLVPNVPHRQPEQTSSSAGVRVRVLEQSVERVDVRLDELVQGGHVGALLRWEPEPRLARERVERLRGLGDGCRREGRGRGYRGGRHDEMIGGVALVVSGRMDRSPSAVQNLWPALAQTCVRTIIRTQFSTPARHSALPDLPLLLLLHHQSSRHHAAVRARSHLLPLRQIRTFPLPPSAPLRPNLARPVAHVPPFSPSSQKPIRDLVRSTALHILEHGGQVRSIKSWGTLPLPEKMRRHKVTHSYGELVHSSSCSPFLSPCRFLFS